jgi:hypothetical protein
VCGNGKTVPHRGMLLVRIQSLHQIGSMAKLVDAIPMSQWRELSGVALYTDVRVRIPLLPHNQVSFEIDNRFNFKGYGFSGSVKK